MKLTGLLLSIGFFLVSCSAIDATSSMPDKMDQTQKQIEATNKKMDETNDIVRQQPVQISFEDMLKPELGVDLLPIPFDILPFAKKFGEYISSDDFIQVVYVWLKKQNESQMPNPTPTQEEADAWNHRKTQTFFALQAICGLLPDAKVKEIVKNHIVGGTYLKEAAKQMLLLRVRYYRDWMLKDDLLNGATPLDSIGNLEQAIVNAEAIEYVARLPFAKELSIDIGGFVNMPPPARQIPHTIETFDTGDALSKWMDIAGDANDNLKTDKAQVLTGDVKTDQKILTDVQKRQKTAMATVNKRIIDWGGTPPLPSPPSAP